MKLGTYRYKHYNVFTREFTAHTLRVEIIGESEKRYQVRYMGFHANGQRPNYTTWVGKNKVTVDGEPAQQTHGQTHAPDIESVRLPYKD